MAVPVQVPILPDRCPPVARPGPGRPLAGGPASFRRGLEGGVGVGVACRGAVADRSVTGAGARARPPGEAGPMTSTGAFGPSPPGTPRTPAAFLPSHRVVASHRGRRRTGRRRTGRRRTPLPVLDGALSETVFHDVPIRGRKQPAHAQ